MGHAARSFERTSHYIQTEGGDEVEVQFKPADWMNDEILVEHVGDKLVVGYLSLDPDPSNPMENADAQGDIYLKSKRMAMDSTIWDDEAALRRALGLDGYDNPDIDSRFSHDGEMVSLKDLAERQFLAEHPEERPRDGDGDAFYDEHGEAIEKLAVDLYRKHWQAIAGPFVIPISYHSERGSTSIGITTWDGDPEDLPDGVWVADKLAEENIQSMHLPDGVAIEWRGALGSETDPLHTAVIVDGEQVSVLKGWTEALAYVHFRFPDKRPGPKVLRQAATQYAESILSELADWCDGNVYGVCVEVFDIVGPHSNGETSYVSESDDAVWGHIGDDYAKQSLNEQFGAAVSALKDKTLTTTGEPT